MQARIASIYLRCRDLLPSFFGEPSAFSIAVSAWVAELVPAQFRVKLPTHKSTRNKGVGMYTTRTVNGIPAIERDRPSVSSVWDQTRHSSNWRCVLLDHKPALLLNEHDREWLKAIDEAAGKVQNA